MGPALWSRHLVYVETLRFLSARTTEEITVFSYQYGI